MTEDLQVDLDSILEGSPSGATHYAILDGMVIYLFKSSHGFRQIKGNLIGFHSTGISEFDIKELT